MAKATTNVSPDQERPKPEAGKKRGWDEIESLFAGKKKAKEEKPAEREPSRRPNRPKHRPQDTASSVKTSNHSDEWVNDGLGGKYNAEGFTGRVEDGCKIFKAHVLSKPNAGQTPLCPFDCTCCYI